jgi:hypothetical protein
MRRRRVRTRVLRFGLVVVVVVLWLWVTVAAAYLLDQSRSIMSIQNHAERPSSIAHTGGGGAPRHTNRLIHEKSPYLLQVRD